jgi:hypothetical protein
MEKLKEEVSSNCRLQYMGSSLSSEYAQFFSDGSNGVHRKKKATLK